MYQPPMPLQKLDAIQDMADSCGQAVIGSSQVTGIVEEVRNRTQILGQKKSYLEAIAHDLSREHDRVVEATTDARHLSQSACEHLARSSDTILASVSELHAVIDLIMGLGEDVARFAAAMDEVSRASQTIDSIARSTNMLALNAAIEAERAGAAGATFAVVASEVKKLAQDTRLATDRIAATIGSLGSVASRVVGEIEKGVDQSRNAQRHFETISQSIQTAADLVAEVDRKTDEIADNSEGMRTHTGELCDNLFVFMADVARCGDDLERALAESDALEDQANDMFNRLLHSGLSEKDNHFVEIAIEGRDAVKALIEAALADGRLREADLFDRDYRPRGEPGLERYDTRFNDFADRYIAPVLDSYARPGSETFSSVITNEDGYLPTHVSTRRKAPTGDPEHDHVYCRNRLKLLDKTTAEAVRQKNARFYAAVYRFEPTPGESSVVRNIYVPLWINQRYWGNFEIAYIR